MISPGLKVLQVYQKQSVSVSLSYEEIANLFRSTTSDWRGGGMLARRILVSIAFFVFVAAGFAQQPQNPCTLAEQKQFDFWVGEWDVTFPGNTADSTGHGTNNITRVLDGCVVQENFYSKDAQDLRGISVSTYDTRDGKWKQTWVDNQGGYLDFTGGFKDGQMILSREFTNTTGKKISQRMVWKNIKPAEFDWSWERSEDGGQTWKVMWPIHYVRRGHSS
jgi:Protein of unknown function (DUF1579)